MDWNWASHSLREGDDDQLGEAKLRVIGGLGGANAAKTKEEKASSKKMGAAQLP